MSSIPVLFQHNRGLIYDVDDYLHLRFTHRISGTLIGVPVSKPRNAHSFALPAVLSSYELKLALEKRLIVLIEREAAHRNCPSEEAKHKFLDLVSTQLLEQKEPFIKKRMAEFNRFLPKIIEGKRKKLLKSGIKEEDIMIDPKQLVADEQQKTEAMQIDRLVQIPLEHPIAVESTSVHFNLAECEQLKYKIFKDIWEKRNVYISGGDSFGCDFLLYPGDPLYYHASHTIHVLMNPELRMNVKYLIRCCRLSVVVNKICTFAYENETGAISYQTMEWEGNVEN